MRYVHLNGQVLPESEARVSPFDRGLLLGDGVFETMRAYAGRCGFLDEHLARLERSCAVARLPMPAGLPRIVGEVLKANGLDEAAVRITLTRGPGGRGASPRGAGPPTLLVTAVPIEARPELWTRGARLATAGREHAGLPLKATNYFVNVLARIEAEESGADDALFVDGDGFVVEATQANLFAFFGERLATPPLDSGCLPGVTRAHILALGRAQARAPAPAPAPAPAHVVEERAVTRDELFEADEVFLSASVSEVVPVIALDGVQLGDGKPGARTRRIHRAYREAASGARGPQIENEKERDA